MDDWRDYMDEHTEDRMPSGWWIVPFFFGGCAVIGAVVWAIT